MSVDAFVDSTQLDSDLTSVANAIRTKSGGSSDLAFPSEFISELNSIVTVKPIIMRSDAELVKTWSKDALIHEDDGVTIPSYSTTATTLVAAESLSNDTYTLDYTNYDYYLTGRGLIYPTYNITTKGKGRVEYGFFSVLVELTLLPENNLLAFVDSTKYTNSTSGYPAQEWYRQLVWSNSSTLTVYTGTTYGIFLAWQDQSVTGGVLTVQAPNARIRGNTTYLVNTYYNAITEIRRQYVILLYRSPKTAVNNGWGIMQLTYHIIDCINNQTHTLT